MDIDVSVLMPVFKPDIEYLKEAVNSVMNQTFVNWELLVIYESSPEDSLDEYFEQITKDSRVKMVMTPSRYGLPKSLNLGIERASGKYLARMDADDVAEPERFQIQYDYMEKHNDVAVLGSMVRIMGTDKVDFVNDYPSSEVRSIRMLFYNAGVSHPTAFIRKEFLDINDIKYNEEIRGSEDYHLWGDIVMAGGKIESINKPLLNYRVHEGQASQVLSKEMILWNNMAKWKQLSRFGIYADDEKMMIAEWYGLNIYGLVDDNFKLFKNLQKNNKDKKIYNPKTLKKELMFQWILKALLMYKKKKQTEMLNFKYTYKMLWVPNAIYVIKNLFKVVR